MKQSFESPENMDMSGKTPESVAVETGGENKIESGKDQQDQRNGQENKKNPESGEDFYEIHGEEIKDICLSFLKEKEVIGVGRKTKYDALVERLKEQDNVALFKLLSSNELEELVNKIIDILPEGASKEDIKEKIKNFHITKEYLNDVLDESIAENVKEKKQGDKNLERHLEEINSKAFELSRLHGNQRKDLQAVSTALEEAEKFVEDQKRKMGDAFDGNRHRRVELLELAIFDLKEDKKRLESAGNLNEALRKDQEEFSRIAEENTRRIGILEKIERGENLTEAEKKERGEMGEITKQELIERRDSAINSLAVAAGIYGARIALEEMKEDREDSLKSLERARALEAAMNIALSRINIETKGMPEQQAQAVERLEKAEVEGIDYFIGVDGERIRKEDLKTEKDKKFFDDLTGNGKEEEVLVEGKSKEEYIEKVKCSIESLSYQHLIDFFRGKTSKQEARIEIASLLRMARREPIADKIMALSEDFYIVPDENVMPNEKKKIEPAGDGKGEVGTIVIIWEDTSDTKWRKTTIKAFFDEYEDSGSLSPILQAVTSREKPIGVSVFEEDLGIAEQNVPTKKHSGSSIDSESADIMGDTFTDEQKALNGVGKAAGDLKFSGDLEPGAKSSETTEKSTIKEELSDVKPGEAIDVKMTDGSHREIVKTAKGFVLKEEIRPKGQLAGRNNNFKLAPGAGTSFNYEDGSTVYVGGISEITAIDGSGKEKEAPLNRDQMKPLDSITIKETDGMVYELTMDTEENVFLRQLRETLVDESGAVQGAEKESILNRIISLLLAGGEVKSVRKRTDNAA